MAESLSVERVHVLQGEAIVIELSDGRTIQVTVAQLLSLAPQVVTEDEPDSN